MPSDSMASQTTKHAEQQDILDDLLPAAPPTTTGMGLGIASRANGRAAGMHIKRDWAHVVDPSKGMPDFHKLVPDMAQKYPFELDAFQKEAVYHLEQRDSVFVAAHTSAGKTVVAEYAVALAMKHMTRCIYTSPIKALSNQKYRDFKQTFGSQNVGILTGDVQINPEAPCLIMTTEILRSMLYRGADLIRDVEFVVFDEVHYVNDQERGVVWEEVIILCPQHINLILLSATVPNTKEFADWVGRTKKKDIYVISTAKRPVPLEHFLYAGKELHKIVDARGQFLGSGIKEASEAIRKRQDKEREAAGDKNLWVHLIGMLKKKDLLPVVAFVFSKRRCEEYASSLPNTDLCNAKEKSEVHVLIEKSLTRLKGTDKQLPQIARMRDLLSRGVGVHHGGLLPIVKEVVELLFQRGLVKVLFATETFAMGVNMPARCVVFSGIRKHDGHEFRELLAGEYTQMSGRAGRRGLDATGVVIINAADDIPETGILNKMLLGQPTKLTSQFRLTYNMILNLLRVEALKVEEMIKRSFSENASQRLLPDQQKKVKAVERQLARIPSVAPERHDVLSTFYDLCQNSVSSNEAMLEVALAHQQGNKMLAPGRVILLRDAHFDWDAAVLVKTLGPALFLVLAAVAPARKNGDFDAPGEHGPPPRWPPRCAVPSENIVYDLREVSLGSIALVTPHALKIEGSMILAHRISAMQRTADMIAPLAAEMSRQESAPEVDWSRIRRLEFQEALRSRDAYAARLAQHGAVVEEEHFPSEYATMHTRKTLMARIAKLQHSISDQNLDLLPDYEARIGVLKALRFVDPVSEAVLLKGRVACEINSADELLLTELILDGFFTLLKPEECVALLSVFVFQEKTDVATELPEALAEAFANILRISERVSAVQTQHQLNNIDYETDLKLGLVEVVYEWAKGMPFSQITDLTDVAEGTIVRCITRLDETCREVRDAARVIGDFDLFAKMEEAQNLIRRDVIFAGSLYF
ncbi:antiviral helicase [Ceraceosorus bombacis]|uniref:Antiviral helicase n=1 Tax=Ceraceosorus bombacis TaxID=401625 RepID=A0A0P1B957_9BASI|nr:antiviral helicase [Ceraceosorus bombacis]